MLSSCASWSTSANIFREWCANCNYSWRAQHYRGQLYDNVMSPISIIVTFPCLELTAHHTNLFFSLGKWSLKWNCTKMRRNLGSWWLDIISYCPAPRQFNFRVKTAQKYNWTLMFSADPRCVLEQGTFIRNRTSNTEIGRAKTGLGTAETGFASPISVLQVLFYKK